MYGQPRRLNRVVIKEELIALIEYLGTTSRRAQEPNPNVREKIKSYPGAYKFALTLGQLIYWSERVGDYDKFLQEEKERGNGADVELRHGWIYKKAEELSTETMLGITATNMGNILNILVEWNLLSRRRNPKNAMDKTYQYRVNLIYIAQILDHLGYTLDGYEKYDPKIHEAFEIPKREFAFNYAQNSADFPIKRNGNETPKQGVDILNRDYELSETRIPHTKSGNANHESIRRNHQNGIAIPEIIANTTSEIITDTLCDSDSLKILIHKFGKSEVDLAVDIAMKKNKANNLNYIEGILQNRKIEKPIIQLPERITDPNLTFRYEVNNRQYYVSNDPLQKESLKQQYGSENIIIM